MTGKTVKIRLDQLLVERQMAESRSRALGMIMAGSIRVDDVVISKAGTKVPADANVTVAEKDPYVSRGGKKLAGALDHFGIDPSGMVTMDAGASTGGFSDCLLQRGAAKVFAVDVGYGQLRPKVADDPRVTVMDRTNVRHLTPSDLGQAMDMIVGDLSFISLSLVLPALTGLIGPKGQMVLLVKPQFEVGRGKVGKGGIVRDPALHESAIASVVEAAEQSGMELLNRVTSSITGAKGNVEFLIHLARATNPATETNPVTETNPATKTNTESETPDGGERVIGDTQ
jgi:23S rRNA (cytidine1920-2'-O)/16S rRNA (cytidine1409-2'-O)-methyltransferase